MKYEVRTFKYEMFYDGEPKGVIETVTVVIPNALRDSDGRVSDYIVGQFETEEEAKKWIKEQK